MLTETLHVAQTVAAHLDALNIPYFVGGSLASSVHGIARATQDIDLISEIAESQVDGLVGAMTSEFYIDADMIREALRSHSSFNLLHLATMIKVDVFVPELTAWKRQEWARRRRERISGDDEEALSLYVASAEDMILQKLLWYRLTGEHSDRQWGDVQGVLKVQAGGLDFAYIALWAEDIGVTDLLAAARAEAGI